MKKLHRPFDGFDPLRYRVTKHSSVGCLPSIVLGGELTRQLGVLRRSGVEATLLISALPRSRLTTVTTDPGLVTSVMTWPGSVGQPYLPKSKLQLSALGCHFALLCGLTSILLFQMGVSNTLLAILNSITALLSLPIIAAGIWLAVKHSSLCYRTLQWPVIGIGVFILLISLAGLLGSSCRVTGLLVLYLIALLLLILALAAFTVFVFIVTHKGAGEAVSGRGYREYRLGDYSSWLQRNVDKSSHWRKIKSCLEDAKVCKSLERDKIPMKTFYEKNLSPIQSGCCKPPTACNFTYGTATSWTNPTNPFANQDCSEWNNDPKELCFDCDSCRAGVLQFAKHDWKIVGAVSVVVVVLLIIIYSMGCFAFRNNRRRRRLPPMYYVKA